MKAGIAASPGAYVLISMADGSDEPHVVDSMVALARDGADVVSASRYMRGGHQIGGPPLKRLMSRTAGLTLHWFAGVPTHDPTNNFKLYSRRFLDTVTIESTAGFELALELTVKATIAGRRVAEVPTTWRDRTAGAEQLQAAQVAAALPALVLGGVPRTAGPARAAARAGGALASGQGFGCRARSQAGGSLARRVASVEGRRRDRRDGTGRERVGQRRAVRREDAPKLDRGGDEHEIEVRVDARRQRIGRAERRSTPGSGPRARRTASRPASSRDTFQTSENATIATPTATASGRRATGMSGRPIRLAAAMRARIPDR